MPLTLFARHRFAAAILIPVLLFGLSVSLLPIANAKTGLTRMIPENFTALSEMVSPAVQTVS